MGEVASETKSLPENAYRPLKPGEEYRPVVAPTTILPEATWRSVIWGLFLCAIFTAASAYSGLKVGQVMEAAIPISILAIGLARVYSRRSSILENVIITGIGGVSGSVVAGAIFTLPALYILKLDPHPWQTIFICLAGGCLDGDLGVGNPADGHDAEDEQEQHRHSNRRLDQGLPGLSGQPTNVPPPAPSTDHCGTPPSSRSRSRRD